MESLDIAGRVAVATRQPHVFTIQYPPSRAYFRERFAAVHDLACVQSLRRALVYLHVPFCETRCYYCNFAVDVRSDPALHRAYVDALLRQLAAVEAVLPAECTVPGIDIGGGTPTLLPTDALARMLAGLVPLRARAEVPHALSIETTPRVAACEPDKLAMMRSLGVDRVSVGIQSTNDGTLTTVNRRAQRTLADAALAALTGAGFRRVHVDLVFGLPGQTPAEFRDDLERVIAHRPDSITTYDCLYRGEGRAFPRQAASLPAFESYREFYDLAYDLLEARGYLARYGSLNFSRHLGDTGTSPYFEGRLLRGLPYLGLGSYASSLVDDRWWFAPLATGDFIDAVNAGVALPAGDAYVLPPAERMAKSTLAMLHFGVLDRAAFAAQFGVALDDAFAPALAHAVREGWLEDRGDHLALRPGRFDVLPLLRALFYSVDAFAWIAREARLLPIVRMRPAPGYP
jgi:oxygen-independent coproporphyrinogen-3 oxidase